MLIKEKLYLLCQKDVLQRVETSQKAIRAAQQSANADSKSSMGDKYETARAMAQLEIEKSTVQLAEALKLKTILEKLKVPSTSTTARLGSLVVTDTANYYLAVGIGALEIEGTTYYAVSLTSPIGATLLGCAVGEEVILNNKHIKILQVL